MRSRASRLSFLLFLLLAAAGIGGCGSQATIDSGVSPDLSTIDEGPADAALRDDLATPAGPRDLAMADSAPLPDLAAPDLAPGADLAAPRADLAAPPDLATPPDLAIVPDLASPPDLAPSLAPATLVIDQTKSVQTSSNQNGILEPGEAVMVETGWRNAGGGATVTGAGAAFTGPVGPTYTLVNSATSYGMVGAGATASCAAPAGCVVAQVSNPGMRPSTHWDVTFTETLKTGSTTTWRMHVGQSFSDTQGSAFYRAIETLLHLGISQGCGQSTFCPGAAMTREQLAIFVARALAGGDANIPAAGMVGQSPYNCVMGGTSLFADVPASSVFCRQIHYIYARGISSGCGQGTFCPSDTVTRDQLALFVARAIALPGAVPLSYSNMANGRAYDCGLATPKTFFADVAAGSTFCAPIHYLWAREASNGCMPNLFCPSATSTREQAAGTVVSAFGLALYGP